ncbi:MAG: hypothetical protein GY775_19285 [Candidatus Scalindua sp.]|nr:hypothetical protein [Candidatus Scalindua sp.]
MISNYVSIDKVIEKINRFKISGGYWNKEELLEWSYDALEAINDKYSKIKASVTLTLKDNKVKIPGDVESIHTVYTVEDIEKRLQELLPGRSLTENDYLLNGGYLSTNLKDSNMQLVIDYYTIPLDANDYPMIPDNRAYLSAVEAYLQFMIGKRAFYQGKILQNQFQALEQEWLFHLPSAQSSQKLNILKDPDRFMRIHNKFIH